MTWRHILSLLPQNVPRSLVSVSVSVASITNSPQKIGVNPRGSFQTCHSAPPWRESFQGQPVLSQGQASWAPPRDHTQQGSPGDVGGLPLPPMPVNATFFGAKEHHRLPGDYQQLQGSLGQIVLTVLRNHPEDTLMLDLWPPAP